jgi:hypothetical protein
LRLPEQLELVRRRLQFEFGSNRCFHAVIIAYFCVQNQAKGGAASSHA